MGTNAKKTKNVITPKGRLGFPNVFEAHSVNGGEAKYSALIAFPPGTDISELKKAAFAKAKEFFGEDKAKALLDKKMLKLPFRSDDAAEKGFPEGSVYINVTSKRKPHVVHSWPGKDGKPAEVTDQDEIYAGIDCRMSLRPFAYDKAGNKGVSFGLCNLQKLGDNERLDGTPAGKDEFDCTDDRPVELDDILG